MEVSILNGYKIKDKKAIRFYNSVDDMKSDTTLKDEMHVKTKGYYNPNDGGGAEYHITATESNSVYQEELENGLYATLIYEDLVKVEQFGAYGDGVHDDTVAIQKAIDTHRDVYFNNYYLVSDTLEIYSDSNIIFSTKARITFTGNGACFYGDSCFYTHLENVRVESSNRTGIGILLEKSRNCVITNAHLTNFSTGIKIDGKDSWSASNVIYNPFIFKFNIGIHLTADLGKQTNDTKVIGGYIIDEIREITDADTESVCVKNDASCDTNVFVGTAVEDANIGFLNKSPVATTPMSLIGCRGENITSYYLRSTSACANLNTIACSFKADSTKVSVSARWDQNLDNKNLSKAYIGGGAYADKIINYVDGSNTTRQLLNIQSDGIRIGPGNGTKQHVTIRGTDGSQNPTNYIKAGGADGLVFPKNFVMKSTNKYWKVNIDDTGAISTEEYTLQDV